MKDFMFYFYLAYVIINHVVKKWIIHWNPDDEKYEPIIIYVREEGIKEIKSFELVFSIFKMLHWNDCKYDRGRVWWWIRCKYVVLGIMNEIGICHWYWIVLIFVSHPKMFGILEAISLI